MADRKELEIDGKPLSSLRVVDLKMELEKRGMSKSGSKKELSDRLKMQLQLEKLHESASTDEGHVPNLRLQDDEIAEHNDIIKDYLAKQQQIYEMQKEAIRRVELEQRVRDSEASAGDTSQEEEDLEQNRKKADEPCGLDLTIATQIKVAAAEEIMAKEEVEKICETSELKDAVVGSVEQDQSEVETSLPEELTVNIVIPEGEEMAKRDSESPDLHEMMVAEVHPPCEIMDEAASVEHTVIENPEMDNDEIAAAVSGIENATGYFESPDEHSAAVFVTTAAAITETMQAVSNISMTEQKDSIQETEHGEGREEAIVDFTVLDLHVAADDLGSVPDTVQESAESKDVPKDEAVPEIVVTETKFDQDKAVEQKTETQVEAEEHKAAESLSAPKQDENTKSSPPRHRPRLKRRNDWGTVTSSVVVEKDEPPTIVRADDNAASKEDRHDQLSSRDEPAVSDKTAEEGNKPKCTEDAATEERLIICQ